MRKKVKATKKSRKTKAVVPVAADEPIAITPIEYGGLQEAYDHFNTELFGKSLPDVFITYQRRPAPAKLLRAGWRLAC
jgi:hypothetical protein